MNRKKLHYFNNEPEILHSLFSNSFVCFYKFSSNSMLVNVVQFLIKKVESLVFDSVHRHLFYMYLLCVSFFSVRDFELLVTTMKGQSLVNIAEQYDRAL